MQLRDAHALLLINKIILLQVSKARDVGVNSVVLFPKVPDALKVFTPHSYTICSFY